MLEQNFQYKFGNFLLDTHDGLLLKNGKVVNLNWQALKVLELLLRNRGHLVQKKDFMDIIWKDKFVVEGNLVVAVSAIRKVLHEDGNKFIETYSRRGYRFNGEVEKTAITNKFIDQRESENNRSRQSNNESLAIRSFDQPYMFDRILSFFSGLTRFREKSRV